MEKKQSSVEWLEIELQNLWLKKYLTANTIKSLFEQAKAMHKEEVEDAWLNGMKGEMIAPLSIDNYRPEAEEYYNETYK